MYCWGKYRQNGIYYSKWRTERYASHHIAEITVSLSISAAAQGVSGENLRMTNRRHRW